MDVHYTSIKSSRSSVSTTVLTCAHPQQNKQRNHLPASIRSIRCLNSAGIFSSQRITSHHFGSL
jgi:hypothetical protein